MQNLKDMNVLNEKRCCSPSDSVLSGFERLRLRAHRRRHRHKTSLNIETDELFNTYGDHLHLNRHQHRSRKNKTINECSLIIPSFFRRRRLHKTVQLTEAAIEEYTYRSTCR
ncbi:hypothetical protein DICVIV_08079 [Dictyocaulus viviparus]|uniref:Uncharacterized protein n=1 Tax=Dictyocaulus viviparus TaxID=29172 RepID=A0A0D8XQ17_DICVI|nr:hypothetical protein DICVIV_08079 [Dictyocaulus viviparus]